MACLVFPLPISLMRPFYFDIVTKPEPPSSGTAVWSFHGFHRTVNLWKRIPALEKFISTDQVIRQRSSELEQRLRQEGLLHLEATETNEE